MLRRLFYIGLLVFVSLAGWAALSSDREEAVDDPDKVPLPTLGGKQLWADELFFHQWRIQRNVLGGECRLLDKRNWRHASGSFEHCRAVLEGIKRDRRLPPMTGKGVIVLHGLGRSRSSMNSLCEHLHRKGGYRVFNVSYPTTRYDVAEHAKTLRRLVNNLEGLEEINFVAHSMGNTVIRHYLGDLERAKAEKRGRSPFAGTARRVLRTNGDRPLFSAFAEADRKAEARFGRFVMLAPPNQGARMASLLADNFLYKQITGEAGQELGRDWSELEKHLAAPRFPFGIIAGGKGDGKGYNPLLKGDNDGTIAVETAKLAGAADFVVVPCLHSFIMDNRRVQKYVLNFLRHGYFISEQRRHALEEKP